MKGMTGARVEFKDIPEDYIVYPPKDRGTTRGTSMKQTIKKTLAFAGYAVIAFLVFAMAITGLAGLWHLAAPEAWCFLFGEDRQVAYYVLGCLVVGGSLCFAVDDLMDRASKPPERP